MSNGGSLLPLDISIAPFPEGFQGDMDETFQQGVQLMSGYVEGNFLTGLILPPGSTLPTSDSGPIAMGETWYFWDSATNQYLPQSATAKPSKNYCKNPIYQIAQQGNALTPIAGVTQNYDMGLTRCSLANTLAISLDVGPPAANGYDSIGSAIKYTVGPALVPAPAATDIYAHEHLIEGCDIAAAQGQILTLSFLVWINQGGTYSVYITNTGRDHSYVSQFTISAAQASTWTRILVPGIPAMPTTAGTWNFGEGTTGLYIGFPLAIGSQWQTGSLNQWNGAFYAGSSANTNLMAVGNNQYKVTGIKLEASAGAGYLVAPSFSADFEDCIRYFFTNFNYQSLSAGVPMRMSTPAAGSWMADLLFPRRMCKAPLVTPYGYQSHSPGFITDITPASPYDIPVASIAATKKGVFATGSGITTTGNVAANASAGTATGIGGTVTTTSGSAILTAYSSATAGIPIGAGITGAGIPAGAVVKGFNGPGQIIISAACTASATGITVSIASAVITSLATMTGVIVGAIITGSGVPAGTNVIEVLGNSSIVVSNPVTPGTGIAYTFGSNTITAIPAGASVPTMAIGMPVTGPGFAPGTTIASIAGSSITLNQGAPAGAGISFTVSPTIAGDQLLAYITADARLT